MPAKKMRTTIKVEDGEVEVEADVISLFVVLQVEHAFIIRSPKSISIFLLETRLANGQVRVVDCVRRVSITRFARPRRHPYLVEMARTRR